MPKSDSAREANMCECGADDFNARNLSEGDRRVPHALNCPKRHNAAPKASEAPKVEWRSEPTPTLAQLRKLAKRKGLIFLSSSFGLSAYRTNWAVGAYRTNWADAIKCWHGESLNPKVSMFAALSVLPDAKTKKEKR